MDARDLLLLDPTILVVPGSRMHRPIRDLVAEYSAEKRPDDGQFYCNIRQCMGYGGPADPFFEKRWRALLGATSKTGSRNLKRIFNHPDFRAAFDVQLDIPGLSSGMRLSTIHKMFAIRCETEILHYLRRIREFWYFQVFQENTQKMRRLSRQDVKAFELTAPGASPSDRETLHKNIRNGELLTDFTEEERGLLWDRILHASVENLIPYLFTFFEDVNFLEAVAPCVRMLVEIPPVRDMSATLKASFVSRGQEPIHLLIQESEMAFASKIGTDTDQVEMGYRQIWISAMRHYEHMPVETKKPDLLARSKRQRSVKTVHNFAKLANKLGFRSPQILTLYQMSPDIEIARNGLLEARPPAHYSYRDLDNLIENLAAVFGQAEAIDRIHVDDAAESGKPPKRSGTPNTRDHANEKNLLFIEQLHKIYNERDTEISPFFIRRSVYFAFFGRLLLENARRDEPSARESTASGQTSDLGPTSNLAADNQATHNLADTELITEGPDIALL